MRRLLVVLAVSLASLAVLTGARRDWVGSATCGTCHPSQLAAWQATAHARSVTRLGRTAGTARCLGCHGTGDAPAGKSYFAEVGCEACHGAGGHYATDDLMRDPVLARALGLVDVAVPAVRAAVCARCHAAASTRLRPVELFGRAH